VTELVALPLWQILAMVAGIVLVVAPAIGVPSAIFGARYGAKIAIELCSQQWDCNMRKAAVNKGWQKRLRRELDEAKREHPDVLAEQRRREDADRSGSVRTRAQEDIDNDGHKG